MTRRCVNVWKGLFRQNDRVLLNMSRAPEELYKYYIMINLCLASLIFFSDSPTGVLRAGDSGQTERRGGKSA